MIPVSLTMVYDDGNERYKILFVRYLIRADRIGCSIQVIVLVAIAAADVAVVAVIVVAIAVAAVACVVVACCFHFCCWKLLHCCLAHNII